MVWVSRILVLAIGVIGYVVALLEPSAVAFVVIFATSILGSAFAPAFFCAVWWRKANTPGAVASMVSGTVVSITWELAGARGADDFGARDRRPLRLEHHDCRREPRHPELLSRSRPRAQSDGGDDEARPDPERDDGEVGLCPPARSGGDRVAPRRQRPAVKTELLAIRGDFTAEACEGVVRTASPSSSPRARRRLFYPYFWFPAALRGGHLAREECSSGRVSRRCAHPG